jgi:hypothetical protein
VSSPSTVFSMESNNAPPKPENPSLKPNKGKDPDTEMLQGRLNSTVLAENPNMKWKDIAGLENSPAKGYFGS